MIFSSFFLEGRITSLSPLFRCLWQKCTTSPHSRSLKAENHFLMRNVVATSSAIEKSMNGFQENDWRLADSLGHIQEGSSDSKISFSWYLWWTDTALGNPAIWKSRPTDKCPGDGSNPWLCREARRSKKTKTRAACSRRQGRLPIGSCKTKRCRRNTGAAEKVTAKLRSCR